MTLRLRRRQRGVTLVELMISITILAVVTAGITRVVLDVFRSQARNQVTVRLQGDARDVIRRAGHELRVASLGAPLGVIWTQDAAGGVVRRPAVQIMDDMPAEGGLLTAKPGSDAVLMVGAVSSGADGAVQGTAFDSTAPLVVTDTAPFAEGMPVLIGPFKAAAWDVIKGVKAGALTLSATQNVFPDGKADSGSQIRQARATLFYLTKDDQLVEQEVLVPRPPATVDEMGEMHVLASGVENLQIDCEMDDGVALGGCAATLDAGAPETTEAVATFGKGSLPRLSQANVAALRSVIFTLVVAGQRGLADQVGDAPIAVGNHAALELANPDPARPNVVRRAYRMSVAVRNTSLGAL